MHRTSGLPKWRRLVQTGFVCLALLGWLGGSAFAAPLPPLKVSDNHHFTHPVLANRPFIRDSHFRFDQPLYTMQLGVGDQRVTVGKHWVEQAHNKFQGSPDLGLYLSFPQGGLHRHRHGKGREV